MPRTTSSEFKAFLKLPSRGEIKRCYYPFKLDTYGRGCSGDCCYCYAHSVITFWKWDAKNPATADFQKIESALYKGISGFGEYAKLFKDRIPLRIGGMTDCFGNYEKTQRVTLRLLHLLKKYDYPYLILTKSALVADPEYIEAMNPELGYIQFSITTPYDDISKVFEKGASLTSERLKAMKVLADKGFYTAGRINPMWPMYKDGEMAGDPLLRGVQRREFRYFDWSLINMLADAGCKTVLCGFVRLSTRNIKWIKEATGEDVTWLFDPAMKQSHSALHFSAKEKKWYYEKAKEIANARGMEFSVCYDGDEGYETFRYLWANPSDCCNGKGKIRGFKNAFDFENPDFIAKQK
jgi:DNA repair photolyase